MQFLVLFTVRALCTNQASASFDLALLKNRTLFQFDLPF